MRLYLTYGKAKVHRFLLDRVRGVVRVMEYLDPIHDWAHPHTGLRGLDRTRVRMITPKSEMMKFPQIQLLR